jgi:hypothetical protein
VQLNFKFVKQNRPQSLMRCAVIVVLSAIVFCGCGDKNPIDQVVKQESSNPYFGNGLCTLIRLPATASPEQLVSNVFKQNVDEPGSVTNIVEVRKVQIIYKTEKDWAATNQERFTYTAVLVGMNTGRKVVLFRYFDGGTNKSSGDWWHRIYDQ